ncbi:hypothetical protein GNX71_28260 [Variovorax sp. RKNM96]|uniref:hypothetical protein n=1 Tax=Variovorax sp. RKNM96 TaxID=2681552 RepID=UPI00197CD92F|nr:hypothetical protein [Variovorax sp. RKNM96]QSI33252.1 hypothetical protein GNX71_28260 [Variovorax sp. RKNM96]
MVKKLVSQADVESPEPAKEMASDVASATTQRLVTEFLMDRYGPVLDMTALAKVLKYRTVAALEQSILRGNLPIAILKLQHRRGTYFLAEEVARFLAVTQHSTPTLPNGNQQSQSK